MSQSILEEIKRELYSDADLYLNVDLADADNGYPHTHLSEALTDRLLDEYNPVFWLEIGTMIGNSAIRVAQRSRQKLMATQVICVDPFTGDVNMWDWERQLVQNGAWSFLALKGGEPTLRRRFLANVVSAGLANSILPIQCTSMVGIRLLRRLFDAGRISGLPEVIYLDSAHEKDETLIEVSSAWSLLKPGGVLFGDDWGWDAVREDVTAFSNEIGCQPELLEGHWLIRKPSM